MRNQWLRRLAALLLLGLLFSWGAQPANAHPADMYTQTYALHLRPDGVTLDYTLSPGPLLAASTWYEADTDGDDTISEAEAQAWLTPLVADWQSSWTGTAFDWVITAVSFPTALTPFELGDERITANLTASFDLSIGGEFALYNAYAESLSINWFYLIGEEGVSFQRPQQENGRLTFTLTLPGADPAPLTYWDSGTPGLVASSGGEVVTAVQTTTSVPPTSAPAPPEDTRPYARLTNLVRAETLTPGFLLAALGIALVLGAMHGLTPGHGKALVAAYLVGSRGTPKHAAALGGIVTLTHTGSVLAIGLLTLAASRFLVPTDLFPILEILSGLLIIGMGLFLLLQRWRGWRGVQQKRTREKAAAVAEASKQLSVSSNQLPVTSNQQLTTNNQRQRITVGADIPVRVYDGVLAAESGPGMVRWRALIGLGISGGLVPCPDAIAILLVAVALNRILLGLSLIVTFSLGLAAILIAIGLAMVQSRRLLARFNQVERIAPAISVASAFIVLGLGLALTWQAASGVGFLAQSGAAEAVIPFKQLAAKENKPAAAFSLDSARVLYVVLNEQGMYQLYTIPTSGGEPTPVTQTPFGIWNYTISPDGQTVVYAALRADRGSDLWLWNGRTSPHLLLECPNAACRNATFAPDGSRIVYEQLDISPENVAATTTLWWLDLDSGETAPVFQDTTLPGFSPAWSPDGQWLSYISPGMPTRIQLYNLADGRSHDFVTMTSMSVVWQPDGASLLLTDVDKATLREGQQALTHLLRFDVAAAQLDDISGRDDVSDSWPTWSADGEQVVFVRRIFTDGVPERGNQVWVMNADGGSARQLTDAANTLHQNLRWSSDGRYLLYHRYNLDEPLAKPSVWLLNIDTSESRELISPGSQPAWLNSR
ncbi:MAG: PD40 domain-containing protein [Ardenticatenaceae bacterium]|nr:PD40 domain-containing protein [Anaerolineales bacterium]MCB8921010.1 PD40 domain-containing protein [Ardenticatenaceae bacterium]MCB9004195.1 PD40 domain-containing protein [Ardenticatenaceae bacterium]